MSDGIATGSIHHLTLTVTDLRRSVDFYTSLLGFQMLMELSPTRVLIANAGGVIAALSTAPDPGRAVAGDRFDENRVGLDHLSFNVGSRGELEQAARLFDARKVSHGEIEDLGPGMRIYVMAFRDPDNIQLELTAPYA